MIVERQESTMYRLIMFLSAVLLLGVIGCDQPGPIEVFHTDAREPIQVNYLLGNDGDSVTIATDVQTNYDLTGVLFTEENLYPATMLVNGATYDINGIKSEDLSYTRVSMRDTDSPISVSGNFGEVAAYSHLDVGNVSLNGTDLEKEEVYLQIRRPNQAQGILLRNGIQYKLLNDDQAPSKQFKFRPNIDYAIVAEGKAQVTSFTERIDSPDKIEIVQPKPYSLILSDEDLTLRWNGRSGNAVVVVISYYDEVNKMVGKPIMELKSVSRANAMLISKKLLNLIPKTSSGKIVLTLISANREEAVAPGYNGKILVQSSSIHNATVTLK